MFMKIHARGCSTYWIGGRLVPSISRCRPNTRRGNAREGVSALHQLLDSVAGHCEEQPDMGAERVTALDGVAKGTVEFVVRNSSVRDYDLAGTSGEQDVCGRVNAVASLAAQLQTDISLAEGLGDKATADLLTEVTRQVDKDLWFLEADLQA